MDSFKAGVSPDNFELLLAALDPDRELAGRKYEELRAKLIQIFAWRRAADAEDLADQAIIRLIQNIHWIEKDQDIQLYAYTIAKHLLLEYRRQSHRNVSLPDPVTEHDTENGYTQTRDMCFRECLAKLPDESRDLIVEYYKGESSDKLEIRRAMAQELGMPLNALRVRVHRIRLTLQDCVTKCLEQKHGAR